MKTKTNTNINTTNNTTTNINANNDTTNINANIEQSEINIQSFKMSRNEFDADVVLNYKKMSSLYADSKFNKNKSTLGDLNKALEYYVLYKIIGNEYLTINNYISTVCKNLKIEQVAITKCIKNEIQIVYDLLSIAIKAKRQLNQSNLRTKLKFATDLNNIDLITELTLKYNKQSCKDSNGTMQTEHADFFTDASIKQASNLNTIFAIFLAV